jgi:hypothetical protein
MNPMLKIAYDYGCQLALQEMTKEAGLFEDETSIGERIVGALGSQALGSAISAPLGARAARATVDSYQNAGLDEHVNIDPTYLKAYDPDNGHLSPDLERKMRSMGGPDYEVIRATHPNAIHEVDDLTKLMGLNSPMVTVTDTQLADHFVPEVSSSKGSRSNPEGRVTASHNPRVLTQAQLDAGGKAVNRAILLHEMGHATGRAPNASLARRILANSTQFGRISSALTPLAAPLFIDPNDERQLAGAIGVNALANLPVLGEEFVASRKAYKALDALADASKITDAARLAGKQTLRNAYKTYLSGAAGGVAGPSIALALMNDDIRDAVNPFN